MSDYKNILILPNKEDIKKNIKLVIEKTFASMQNNNIQKINEKNYAKNIKTEWIDFFP